MPQTVQVVRTTTHDLSITGRAGAISFVLLVTLVTFIAAIAAAGWAKDGRYQWGLWQKCYMHGYGKYTQPRPKDHAPRP